MVTPRWMGARAAAATASTPAEGGEALAETALRLEPGPVGVQPSPCDEAARADMMQRFVLAERRFEHELAALERLILVPVPTRP